MSALDALNRQRLEQIAAKKERKEQARRHFILGDMLMRDMFSTPGADKIALEFIGQMPERNQTLFAEIVAQLKAKIEREAPPVLSKPKPARRSKARNRDRQPTVS